MIEVTKLITIEDLDKVKLKVFVVVVLLSYWWRATYPLFNYKVTKKWTFLKVRS